MSSAAKLPTFECYNCGHQSRYLPRDTGNSFVLELKTMFKSTDKSTRTYKCEICGQANEITLSELEWSYVDLSC